MILVASTMHDSAIRAWFESRGCRHVIPVGYLNRRLPQAFRAREYDGAAAAVLDPANRPAIEAAFMLMADGKSQRVFAGKLAYLVDLDKRQIDSIRSDQPIYFDSTVFRLGDAEDVIDAGAFTGDTMRQFLSSTSGQFRSYTAFEPDPESFAALASLAAADPARVTVVNAGLGLRTERLRFAGTHGTDARVLREDDHPANIDGCVEIAVVSLDSYLPQSRFPTIIKMDIEGSEADALNGGAGVIARCQPLLAISAYHHPSDLWVIPLLLNSQYARQPGLSPPLHTGDRRHRLLRSLGGPAARGYTSKLIRSRSTTNGRV